MTPAQVTTVQRSFSAVLPRADAVARGFYAHLFALHPSLEALFKDDMAEQRRKLMLTLGSVVQQLHDIGSILPGVRALAVRHAGYGVEERDYPVVGQALLQALAQAVPDFGTAERDAWEAAYTALSSAMIDAAREAGGRSTVGRAVRPRAG